MSTLFIFLTKNAPYIPINKFRGFTVLCGKKDLDIGFRVFKLENPKQI